jgi:ABC-2 type transport system permease protein
MTTVAQPLGKPTAANERSSSIPPNLARSEWAKLRSVRSTYWSLFVAGAAMIVIGAIAGAVEAHAAHITNFDPVLTSLDGVILAQFVIGILGVLVIASEYSTGMIRSTFVAAPQRRTVIGVKAGVVGVSALVVGTASSLVAFLVGQAVLGHRGVALGAPGALRSVVGVGMYLALLGVLTLGLGTIIRSTVGAVTAFFGLMLILPAVLPAFPASVQNSVGKFLPYNAGQAIFSHTNDPSVLSPWAGLAVFALYAGASLTIALVLVRRRDA